MGFPVPRRKAVRDHCQVRCADGVLTIMQFDLHQLAVDIDNGLAQQQRRASVRSYKLTVDAELPQEK